MKLHLPNSASLQNIDGFLRKYSGAQPERLDVSMHDRYVYVHPAALAMAACLGEVAKLNQSQVTGTVHHVSSLPYLVRMHLFEHLQVDPHLSIQEHAEEGRFIPLTQVRNDTDLRRVLTDLIPLLHASIEVADPIRYVISEMVRNVLEHAASPVGALVCAQYYRDQQRLAVGIADAGIGIRKSISRSHVARTEEEGIALALQPGVTGATSRRGGNEFNAGAGLFFTKSIAALSRNFFVLYSGDCMFKLLTTPERTEPQLHPDPREDRHKFTKGLPPWQGTVVGIDINVGGDLRFQELMGAINRAYDIDVHQKKKALFKKKIRFES